MAEQNHARAVLLDHVLVLVIWGIVVTNVTAIRVWDPGGFLNVIHDRWLCYEYSFH